MTPIFANSAYFDVPGWVMGVEEKRLRLKSRYGLVRHPKHGSILLDTGCSPACSSAAKGWRLKIYAKLVNPKLEAAGQCEAFLARHGLSTEDIRYVVVTHFHADHISALRDFSKAKLVASRAGFEDLKAKSRTQNALHGNFLELLPEDFEARLVDIEACAQGQVRGERAYDLFGDGSFMAVAIPGHAAHQFGVYIASAPRPVFYAADAHWLKRKIASPTPYTQAQNWLQNDEAAARASLKLVLNFSEFSDIVLCHDPEETIYDDAHM